MTPEDRVAHRWLTRASTYQTKDGVPINLGITLGSPDRGGWVLHKVTASLGDSYLKISYIPEEQFQQRYPTLLHYLGNIEGRHYVEDLSTPEGRRAASIRVLGLPEGLPPTEMSDRVLTNLIKKKFQASYDSFRDYHLNKPQVDYVHTDTENLRNGVGTAMYEYTARWLSRQGLALWSSSTQTSAAKGMWASLVVRGFPVHQSGNRLYLKY